MQPDPTPDLDELTKLEKAATPGPWTGARMVHADRCDALTHDELVEYFARTLTKSAAESGTSDFFFTRCEKADGPADVCHTGNGPTSWPNAALIAAARNALPWLLRAARELDELRAIMSGDMDDFVVKAQEEAMAKLRARAEKAEARAKELEGLYARQCALTELKDDRAARAEARAKELEAELYGPVLETLRDLLSTYGPDDVLVKAHRIERAREVCARIEAAQKQAEGR